MKKEVGGGGRIGWGSGSSRGGQGGCEPRIEVIVKMQRKVGVDRGMGVGVWEGDGVGWYGSGIWDRGGVGYGDVNQELKVLLNVHQGIVQY